jgi:hypothetical protein
MNLHVNTAPRAAQFQARSRRKSAKPAGTQPRVEALEDRQLLASPGSISYDRFGGGSRS